MVKLYKAVSYDNNMHLLDITLLTLLCNKVSRLVGVLLHIGGGSSKRCEECFET